MHTLSAARRCAQFAVATVLVAAALLLPTRADAQTTTYPTRYTQRPLTLGSAMLRIDASAIYTHRAGPPAETFGLDVGLGVGLTPDLELGAVFLPLQLAPEFDYQRPSVYLMGRFVRGTAEVAARGSVTIPTSDSEDALIEVGLPILIHLGQSARLDLGAFLQLETADPLRWWVRFPVALTINVSPRLVLGPYAAFRVRLDAPGNQIPLGFLVAYTIGGGTGSPVGDVGGQFQFDDVTGSAGNWSLALVTRWFLYL